MNESDKLSADDLQEIADGMRGDCAQIGNLSAEAKAAAENVRMVSAKYKESDLPSLPEIDEVAAAYEDLEQAARRLQTAGIRMLDRLDANAQILRGGE